MDCDIVLCLLCRFLSRLDTLWWIMLVVVGFGWNWRVRVCWPDVLRGGALGELVCEVTAVGKYAGRPLKAGDAAQPGGCSARFVPAVFGPVWICRTRDARFGVREGKNQTCRTRNGLFGVRDRIRKGKCVLTRERSRVRTHFGYLSGEDVKVDCFDWMSKLKPII